MAIFPLRLLLADDSAIFRKVLKSVLGQDPRFDIVGMARNGEEALELIERHGPDAMILDVEMPVMDGLQTLKAIRKKHLDVEVIMFSSLTRAGAETTFQALEWGAFDFVAKPEADSISTGMASIQSELIPKLTFLHTRKTLRAVSGKSRPTSPSELPVQEPKRVKWSAPAVQVQKKEAPDKPPSPAIPARPQKAVKRRVVALGISTGGPRALASMMVDLPADLGTGLLIVQHMPPVFTQTLAQRLNEICPLEVREAADGDVVSPGLALIAPGGRHMTVARGGKITDPIIIRLNDGPPEHNCRPSVDVLFRSVADVYGRETVGVIMTGMGSDGTPGLRLLKEKGAYIIAQDEASCTVYGMPKKAVDEGLADEVLPLKEVASSLVRAVSKGYDA